MANAPLVMRAPEPQVLDQELRRIRRSTTSRMFWVEDYAIDRDGARPGAHQHLVHLPPPQHRDPVSDPDPVRAHRRADQDGTARCRRRRSPGRRSICSSRSSAEARHALAMRASHHLFAAGEAIVRQDAEGDSMFVLMNGQRARRARAVGTGSGGDSGRRFLRRDVDADRRSPQRHGQGGRRRRRCWRFQAKDFRELALANPDLLDHVSTIMSARRTGLEDAKATAAAVVAPEAKQTFLARMRSFLDSALIESDPTQIRSRALRRLASCVTSTMMPGPCFSMSSTRN